MDRGGGATPNFAGDLSRHCTVPGTAEIRRNRDRLAGSSVSIVGFYDGILTVHLASFSHDDDDDNDNTGTALRRGRRVREEERAERERNGRAEREERRTAPRRGGEGDGRKGEKGEAYEIGLKGCGLVRVGDYS